MKDYGFYLWIAYLSTAIVLLANLITPIVRYYKLFRKKRAINSLILKK